MERIKRQDPKISHRTIVNLREKSTTPAEGLSSESFQQVLLTFTVVCHLHCRAVYVANTSNLIKQHPHSPNEVDQFSE